MATTTEGRIAKALFTRLAALTLSPALPVAWPNKAFDQPDDDKYLRATYIPNTTGRAGIGSNYVHRYIGLFQVDVFWPKNRGEMEPREIAGAVIDHFSCDLTLTEDTVSVRITKRPEAAMILVEDGITMIPVRIEYEAFA